MVKPAEEYINYLSCQYGNAAETQQAFLCSSIVYPVLVVFFLDLLQKPNIRKKNNLMLKSIIDTHRHHIVFSNNYIKPLCINTQIHHISLKIF